MSLDSGLDFSNLVGEFNAFTNSGTTGGTPGAGDPAATTGTGGLSSSGGGLIESVQTNLEESLAINSKLQELYLAYSTFTEALRIISEAVQKGIDISENERQDISQGQE